MTIYTFLSPDGARCRIDENGGQICSWLPAGGAERLFLSPRAGSAAGGAMRGGVPVIFPQFNARGPYARHGFARRVPWTFLGEESGPDGRMRARFELRDSAATRAEWPFAFRLELVVVLGGQELVTALLVQNPGPRVFSFSAALHTYLAVAEIGAARVDGLAGARYQDWATGGGGAEATQAEAELAFEGEMDRIYFAAPSQVTLREGGRRLKIAQRGFSDMVIWNPGPAKGPALADLEADGWRKFVCIEAALIDPPVTLLPEGDWVGEQVLSV